MAGGETDDDAVPGRDVDRDQPSRQRPICYAASLAR
jgi:hypothetical protein